MWELYWVFFFSSFKKPAVFYKQVLFNIDTVEWIDKLMMAFSIGAEPGVKPNIKGFDMRREGGGYDMQA